MVITVLAFCLIFIVGFISASALSIKLPLLQRVGLSFPLGFGVYTVFMVVLNIVSIKFSILILSVLGILYSSILLLLVVKPGKLKDSLKISVETRFSFKNINLSWILLVTLLIYVLYGLISKALFWPPVGYDTVTGYDYMAKVVAAEGCFNNSIFDPNNLTASIRHSYPPYVSGTYSIPYMLGMQSSKISLVLIFLSFVILFWSVLKQYTGHTLTIFFTLLLFTTPEFLAMSALSLTNVPQTIFASIGLIKLHEYLIKRDKHLLILASVLISLNIWCRLDGVVFFLAGGMMILIKIVQEKTFKQLKNYYPLFIYSGVAISSLVFWEVFKFIRIENVYESSNAFRKELFFDAEKLSELWKLVWDVVTDTQLYGITLITFVVVIFLNTRHLLRNNFILLMGILVSFGLYFFLYYQMNTDSASFGYSVSGMVKSSFKRGIFPFLPLLCFYMATSKSLNNIFNWLTRPLLK